MILYEYPLTERIRSLLRLEDVFQRATFFRDGDGHHQHVCALASLFDLLDLTARSDLRSDLMAELDAQGRALSGFRGAPSVSTPALENLLTDVRKCHETLAASGGKPGHALRDNEWLMAVRSRTLIAGGAADYDMPSFWAWQHLPVERRRADIDRWLAPFRPFEAALALVLRLLRESGSSLDIEASDGSCQHALGGQTYQLAQLHVDPGLGAIPDISANKYLLWIRFSSMNEAGRLQALERPVRFKLTLCNLQ